MILPTSNSLCASSPGSLSKKFLKTYLFKMFRPHKKQMDFDLALFLMLNALKAPNKLYQHTKRLK
jgi:hypothetical protein